MVRQNLSAGRGEKPSAKNIQVYFRTVPSDTHQWVIVFVGRWLATGCHPSVVQSQPGRVVAEGQHNMNEADTRLVRLDDCLRKLALGLEFLKAALYCD